MDKSFMFDFYKLGYEFGAFDEKEIKEAFEYELITSEEYKLITGKDL